MIGNINQSAVDEVRRWKLHYGLRPVGKTTDGKVVVSGLDAFKLTSSVGIDLDFFLLKISPSGLVVDWVGYATAATVEGWLIETIISKLKYPITENYGERYWRDVEARIKLWFIAAMEE